tara:strand:- start:697 stop:1167 length:471 start_codon:yes stop_codon:yes gene_type:complete
MRFYLTMVLVALLGGCSLILWTLTAEANDLNFGFKNPAFHSGNGYSSHVLSMEQLRFTRKKEAKEKLETAAAQAIRDAKNNTVSKFLVNVESRIYAQLSKQLVDNMFGEGSATSGTSTIEGNEIYWEKLNGVIHIRITEEDGTVTTMSVPVGDFSF